MHSFSAALIYLGFFALIGFTIYFTESAWPLIALILTPSYTNKTKKDSDDKKSD